MVVDTNILIYAADIRSGFHRKARNWLERQQQRPDAWYVTWPIVFEFLRVTTHVHTMRQPWTVRQGWSFISGLLQSPGLGMLNPTERHEAVAAQVFSELPLLAGNIMHDAHTAILMREHGVWRICTHDADFRRFPFLDVLDPLR